MNSEKETVYRCMKCGSLYYSYEAAETCCGPKTCKECGKEIPYWRELCYECRDKRLFDEAKKIHLEDYKGSYVYDYISEDYFSSIDDLIDFYHAKEEELPKYCYACTPISYSLDIYSVIEDSIVDLYEEYEEVMDSLVDLDKLEAFVEEWNKKQVDICYEQDQSTVILLDDIK